jgi:hypothetical protein
MKKEFKKKDCNLNGHNVFELRSVKEIVDMYNDNMHESIIKQSIVRFLSKFISNRGVQVFKHNELPIIEYNCNITLNNQQTSKISKITFDPAYEIIQIKFEKCDNKIDLEELSVIEQIRIIQQLV